MSDAAARREADSLTSQNVVLRASAGTGKTTVLVERLLVLLLRDGLDPGQIVAITFTEDAAANMKSRLRRRLQDAFRWSLGEDVKPPLDDAVREAGDESVGRRAAAALEQLDRAVIETIHAFAGCLLRMFPEESGVDASFAVDDENAVAESIDRAWAAWSREEFAEGLNSVAAPIADASGEVVAAVHVHGPSYRFPRPGTEDEIAAPVVATAARICGRLRSA